MPTADIALLWHTHLGLSESYAAMCGEVFGTKRTAPWAPAYLTMGREQLAQGYSTTARLWWEAYGGCERVSGAGHGRGRNSCCELILSNKQARGDVLRGS